MFANLKLVLRSYTSLYGIFMSASLIKFTYTLLARMACVCIYLCSFCLYLFAIQKTTTAHVLPLSVIRAMLWFIASFQRKNIRDFNGHPGSCGALKR